MTPEDRAVIHRLHLSLSGRRSCSGVTLAADMLALIKVAKTDAETCRTAHEIEEMLSR